MGRAMKTALITAALFLISYIAVNRGLGENPLFVVISVIVVVGVVVGLNWVRARGRAALSKPSSPHIEKDMSGIDAPHAPPPTTQSRGRGAKKTVLNFLSQLIHRPPKSAHLRRTNKLWYNER